MTGHAYGLEVKLAGTAAGCPVIGEDLSIEGYASLFGEADKGGDVVRKGAYTRSLERLTRGGSKVRMLWQHDPARPIGVWDEIRETDRGLWVKGRLLGEVSQAREAAALVAAGALDGLSIGYRTISAERSNAGRRELTEIDLWEVSLVTFPMLPAARLIHAKAAEDHVLGELAQAFRDAAQVLRSA